MPNPSQLAEVRADKEQFFSANSRSFSFASLGFKTADRSLVQSVYAFCRITDDLVDEHMVDSEDEIGRELDNWASVARDAFLGTQLSGIAWLDDLMRESSLRGVPFDIIEALIEGVRIDASLTQIETLQDLRSYCYGVASTVGIWMCYLFDAKDPVLLERAEALGRAMQITNILRDVGEDLEKGRVYLPNELLRSYDLSTFDLINGRETGTIPDRYEELLQQLMKVADDDYEKAWEAIPLLPWPFARAAAVASEVYRGIHKQIEKNGYDNLTRRARTGFVQKVLLMLKALTRLGFKRWIHPRKKSLTPGSSWGKGSISATRRSMLIILPVLSVIIEPTCAQESNTITDEVRETYWHGGDHENIDSLQVLLRSEPELLLDPIALAYDAALEVLKAKHAFWPGKKLEHVNNGLPVLDSLITANPSLIEPRYLRLLSCYFLPSLLKRQWSVEEDIRELALLLPEAGGQVPVTEYKKMLRFLLQNGHLDGTPEYDRLLATLNAVYDAERMPTQGSSG